MEVTHMPYRSSPASLARQRLIHDFPSWRVPDKPASRRGQPPSQPRETASAAGPTRPLLWLARREGLLLLVNESGGYLHRVKAVPYGYHLRDRMRLQVATDGDCYDYQRVPPGSAVLVAEYGPRDRDVVCGIRLAVQATHLGCLAIHPPTAKGGVEETVLIWAHGGNPGHVTVLVTPTGPQP